MKKKPIDNKSTNAKILKQVREIYFKLRSDVNQKWHRDLPLEELLFDRWERAKHLGFGEKSSIYHNSYVYGNVKVGKNTWIGPFTLLDGTGGLTIGNNCNISSGVHIYSHDTVKSVISGGLTPYEHKPVKIGNNCFIGPHTVIRAGVTIGDHVVIGACSFVNHDIPSYCVAFGAPAVVTGKIQIKNSGKIKFIYSK